jgi:hypothetical protein
MGFAILEPVLANARFNTLPSWQIPQVAERSQFHDLTWVCRDGAMMEGKGRAATNGYYGTGK